MKNLPRAVALMTALSLCSALAAGASAQAATYDVTIVNVTTGQPFSPPYVATSKSKTVMFKVGKPASSAIQEVAENGDTALTMRNYLVQAKARGSIFDWAGGVPPATKPLAPSGTPGASGAAVNSAGKPAGPCSALNFPCPATETIRVRASNHANKLSLASMLVCSNDGFVGLAGVRLPSKVGGTLAYNALAYDTGTEKDTQNFEDLMPWCQSIIGTFDQDPHPLMGDPFGPLSGQVTTNPDLAEGGKVTVHPGLASGVGELGSVHAWSGPVAKIAIKRVD